MSTNHLSLETQVFLVVDSPIQSAKLRECVDDLIGAWPGCSGAIASWAPLDILPRC